MAPAEGAVLVVVAGTVDVVVVVVVGGGSVTGVVDGGSVVGGAVVDVLAAPVELVEADPVVVPGAASFDRHLRSKVQFRNRRSLRWGRESACRGFPADASKVPEAHRVIAAATTTAAAMAVTLR